MTDTFSLDGRVAIVTGGTGSLGSVFAATLASAGASVAVLARGRDRLDATVERIRATGGDALGLTADVLELRELERARDTILERYGRIDILVNAAGGNLPEATLGDDQTFFDLAPDAFDGVLRLNFLGTLLPCHVFGAAMAAALAGDVAPRSIVNVSSMASRRAISRVVGYSAAKAAVENFTRWLAVDCARTFGDLLRVNAIAPGFFLAEQNRRLLVDERGGPTERSRTIVARTPGGRLGEPPELGSTLLWLCSPASRFVTGVVVPVDGGFDAWSGV